MMDFTLISYKSLLNTLIDQGFSLSPFEEFFSSFKRRAIVLRHDVDSLPANSLIFAGILAEKGIKGTFYFRIVPESFDEDIIKEIAGFGHEIGYHYEDLSFAWAKLKAQGAGHRAQEEELEKKTVDIGIDSFNMNLEKFRKIVPVKTICMHGSPMSRWDSRLLWKYFDYKDFGIVGEPYFDINFDEVLYLTDTGRRWDGGAVSVRDKGLGIKNKGLVEDIYEGWKVKPVSGSLMNMTPESIDFQNQFKFRSTFDIIKAAERGELPDKMMMTFHPQRWTDKPIPWVKELVWQNMKNVGKYFLIKVRE